MSTKKKDTELFDDATYQQFLRGLDEIPDISFNPAEDVAREEERIRKEAEQSETVETKKRRLKKVTNGKRPKGVGYVNLCLREDLTRKLALTSTLLSFNGKGKISRSDLIEQALDFYLKKVHPKIYETYLKLSSVAEGEDGDV